METCDKKQPYRAYPTNGVIKTPEVTFSLYNTPANTGGRGHSTDAVSHVRSDFRRRKEPLEPFDTTGRIERILEDQRKKSVSLTAFQGYQGYGCQRPSHPFYRTSGSDYGLLPPPPQTFERSERLNKNGSIVATPIHRHRSLNIN